MLTETQIKTAARWWTEKLCSPPFDNGDDTNAGGMATMMALMVHRVPSADSAERFESTLAASLRNVQSPHFTLSVDYGPDETLSDALTKAGLSTDITALPWKTTMRFDGDSVQVKCGYSAKYEDLPLIAE